MPDVKTAIGFLDKILDLEKRLEDAIGDLKQQRKDAKNVKRKIELHKTYLKAKKTKKDLIKFRRMFFRI